MPNADLECLEPPEQKALAEFAQRLRELFDGGLRSALLFGSKAHGESTPDSDLDVLVVVDSDDWRVHKQIRCLAADICLKYGLEPSPRVWSREHHKEMERLQAQVYQNIHKDGITLPGL